MIIRLLQLIIHSNVIILLVHTLRIWGEPSSRWRWVLKHWTTKYIGLLEPLQLLNEFDTVAHLRLSLRQSCQVQVISKPDFNWN